ncbi:hypothetical protein D3C87_1533770 [compost metagenome]
MILGPGIENASSQPEESLWVSISDLNQTMRVSSVSWIFRCPNLNSQKAVLPWTTTLGFWLTKNLRLPKLVDSSQCQSPFT